MRIRTRLTLLLTLLVLVFVAGVFAIRILDVRRHRRLVSDRTREKSALFDRLVELQGKSCKNLSYDYSYWDDMVKFVKTRELNWAHENIDEGLKTYGADAAWVLTTDYSLVYATASEGNEPLTILPLPQSVCGRVFGQTWTPHFWAQTGQGLAEFWGAPIQPSSDATRQTPPKGFFMVGKVWSPDVMTELGGLIEGSVQLEPVRPGADSASRSSGVGAGRVFFRHALSDWNGATIATVAVQGRSVDILELVKQSNRLLLVVILLAAAIQLLLSLALMNWVNKPLDLVSRALESKRPDIAFTLEKRPNEFGNLARLIRGFFEQQEKLATEVTVRKEAQVELARHQQHLEELVQERTRELQQAQEQLVGKERLATLGQVAGSIAHDLRNPLGITSNSLYYLNAVLPRDLSEKVFEHLGMMKRQMERANEIITTMLDFGKGRPAERRPVPIRLLLDDSLACLAIPGHVTVERAETAGIPWVLVDPAQMRMVFVNLIKNAVQAMPDGGRIRIAVDRPANNGLVQVALSDTGRGIAPDALGRVFEAFFTTRETGTGLGLAIVRSFIERNHGSIEVQSEVDKGTTFTLTLPAAEETQRTQKSEN